MRMDTVQLSRSSRALAQRVTDNLTRNRAATVGTAAILNAAIWAGLVNIAIGPLSLLANVILLGALAAASISILSLFAFKR